MAARQNEYVKRRWQQLIDDSGGACAQCNATQETKPLEFAHLEQPREVPASVQHFKAPGQVRTAVCGLSR